MYFVYILYSTASEKYYTGSTDDLFGRLKHHNGGHTPSTRSGSPNWKIVYTETFQERSEALKREKEIKNKKSKKYIEWLINSKL
jgi:putative endonuclease